MQKSDIKSNLNCPDHKEKKESEVKRDMEISTVATVSSTSSDVYSKKRGGGFYKYVCFIFCPSICFISPYLLSSLHLMYLRHFTPLYALFYKHITLSLSSFDHFTNTLSSSHLYRVEQLAVQSISLYTEPPYEEISIDEFELYALDRLIYVSY